ncbi:glutamate-1-semialdehyde 2,1-aminomutase [Persicobacter psychrovividus]|uniref:Glutamate-1-semialdehyde 2,1-aminomutase n=1 Tax=Persicobacter psychrovividus TaxID=387638 RepID=A0ABN6L9R2_9BACT|nr:glutamate-1-semialdehyde 2,1-aminomutase [Persicobacter psychrovividus]
MITKDKSQALFEEAQNYIPGGVNSPVRAFKAVGGNPLFIKSAKGAYMYDVDGNAYVDLINSWGPMIFGHADDAVLEAVQKAIPASLSFGAPGASEVEIAALITDLFPSIEKVRMVNSGTEATMSAIRLARGYTGREKMIKFEGCYHGHGDSFLIAAGSGAITMGEPNSPGVTVGTAKDTLTAPYNNLEAVKTLVAANKNEVAAIILEPVAGNMGCVLPHEGYLQGLREICDQEGILLIVDEVMTGFRLAAGGAQEVFDVRADITTLGKIIGGGMPVGAYGGKREIMDYVSPQGPVYQAGTLSGNPISMAAGLAQLNKLKADKDLYNRLAEKTERIEAGIKKNLKELGLNYTTNRIGSMFTLFFTDQHVTNFEEAKACDLTLFGKFFNTMLEEGVYLPPSQFESWFISDALGDKEIDQIISASYKALKNLS